LWWFHTGNPTAPRTLTRHTTAPFTVIQGARMLVSVLVTFLVVILVLYLINMLPLDGRAKQICRVVVIVIGVISLLKYIAVF
jgi:Na+/melibiose symporter-like transporter